MSDYNFTSLSGFEFERVVRDLLQEAHGVSYQTSPPGPDGGVDLRYVDPAIGTTIIQCKHYAKSRISTLLSRLRRDELPKVRNLAPERYMLVTSLDLSSKAKDEIAAVFAPFCQSSNDVLGGVDVSNLLEQHPSVADKHIKLWLTSEPVLRRVLLAGIFDDSEREVERIRRRLALFVPNPSLPRARKILDEQHVCVIAGLPGIGKTTLAQMLLIEYESRGYHVVRVPNHLSQVLGTARRGAKTVFYFDDFLGQTVLERWERNEDQRLVEFMESVRNESNWRFILTTREYILEEAKLRSEALSRLQVGDRTCIIRLEVDYTLPVRARILYQHLYFSDLDLSYTLALIRSGATRRILDHRNYSPRLIDLLTSRSHTPSLSADDYVREFLQTLDDPHRLWAVAFRAMDSAARDLAITMASMPNYTSLEMLQLAFEAFRACRAARLNQSRRPDEFEESLRVLDGTMLLTRVRGVGREAEITVTFHNPSVRDFLQSRLARHSDDVLDLVASGVFIDQFIRLFEGDGNGPFPAVVRNADSFVAGVAKVINQETAHYHSEFEAPSAYHASTKGHTQSLESRALFSFDIARVLGTAKAESLREEVFNQLCTELSGGATIHRSHAAMFLRQVYGVHQRDHKHDATLVEVIVSRIIKDIVWDSDVQLLIEILNDLPHIFNREQLSAARKAVRACAESFAEGGFSPETRALYSDAASILRQAAKRLDLNIRDLLEVIEERARSIEEDEEYTDDEIPYSDSKGTFAVDELFSRLEREMSTREEEMEED